MRKAGHTQTEKRGTHVAVVYDARAKEGVSRREGGGVRARGSGERQEGGLV